MVGDLDVDVTTCILFLR